MVHIIFSRITILNDKNNDLVQNEKNTQNNNVNNDNELQPVKIKTINDTLQKRMELMKN